MLKLKITTAVLLLSQAVLCNCAARSAEVTQIWNFDSINKKDVYIYFVGVEKTYIKAPNSNSQDKQCLALSQHLVISDAKAIPYMGYAVIDTEAEKKKLGVGKANQKFDNACELNNYSFHWSHASFHRSASSASNYKSHIDGKAAALWLKGAITAIVNVFASEKAFGLSDLVKAPYASLVNFVSGATNIKTSISVDDLSSLIIGSIDQIGKVKDEDAKSFVSNIANDVNKGLLDNASLVPENGYLVYTGKSSPVFAGPTKVTLDQAAIYLRRLREKREEAAHKEQKLWIDAVFKLSRTRTAFVSGKYYMVWNEDGAAFESDPILISERAPDAVVRFAKNDPITAASCTHDWFDAQISPHF